ncbi:UNVERIFIED_CONTAM: hypothetical protein PYX00_005854 [Menopon gallinae]|uniref:Ribosomal RNA-processing protein 8 n=1 Tax=Menopon gallinae TaxID=328185 RepID=A0AAW2HUF3_9NEOP
MAKRITSSRAKQKNRAGRKLKAKKIHFKSKKSEKDKKNNKSKKNVANQVRNFFKSKEIKNTPLRERMLLKLKSSRFRYMNEQFYNMKGNEALNYFKRDKDAFVAYHEGYKTQVQQWPINPLDEIIKSLQKECSSNKNLVIADFGCGDATLAKSLPNVKVHSFDLVALDPCVTVCDMANTPLENSSVDIAVFCLSLMGTNFTDYLVEANRVLKEGGRLKIAEVESRFEKVEKFVRSMSKLGFVSISKNFSHQLFYFMDFKKEGGVCKNVKSAHLTLKPCVYKRR